MAVMEVPKPARKTAPAPMSQINTKPRTTEGIMKRHHSLVQRMRLPAFIGLVLLGMATVASPAWAKSEPFSHLVVFGDSLSDTGNYYRLSGGSPPAPYAGGRFCNGP